jgi:hypothetical protein
MNGNTAGGVNAPAASGVSVMDRLRIHRFDGETSLRIRGHQCFGFTAMVARAISASAADAIKL